MSESSPDRWQALALQTGQGTAPGLHILRERGTDVRIARVQAPSGVGTVIVKLWNRPHWRGALRRLTRTNIGWQEYAALRRLEPQHIGTPHPLAYFHLHDAATPYTEVLISTDLGDCRDSTEFFKNILRTGPESAVREFEDHLISSTVGLLASGLIDTDHRLPNFVVLKEGRPVRLDFELCRPTRCVACHPRQVGLMLAALMGSYAFAVQPRVDRILSFASRLQDAVRPSTTALRVASEKVAIDVARQEREVGIRLSLPPLWTLKP